MNEEEQQALFNKTYEKFKGQLLDVSVLQDQALFALTYAGYARVGEIVRGRYKPNPPVTKSQIELTDSHLTISILTEKILIWRKVPVSRQKEQWLIDIIQSYIEAISGEQLFPYSTRWAELRFKRWFGTERIHMLRHWATTHTLQGFRTVQPLMPQEVARLGGWLDFNTFYKTYSHYIIDDFKHKI